MPNLYLDDIRFPKTDGDWVIARTVEDAQKFCLAYGCPQQISFDHDLGDDVPSGHDFAKWLVETDLDQNGTFIPRDFTFNVHSANPVGLQNIEGLLRPYLAQR